MNVTLIGRSAVLYAIGQKLLEQGHTIALIVTSKEAPEHTVTSKDLENFAASIGAEYLYAPKIMASDIAPKIAGKNDIGLSVNYTGIITQDVIDLFAHGILNAHGGDLPRYKGNACQAWAIINGEKEIGLCVHKMIGAEIDEGKIITRAYFQLHINTRVGEVYKWMEEQIPVLMTEAVELLQKDKNFYIADTKEQNNVSASRCYPRNPEDGKIDWTNRNVEILKLINASSEPFAGAFASFEDKPIRIWRAELFNDNEIYMAVPGQVAAIKIGGHVDVITGEGKLRLLEVEYEQLRTSDVAGIIKTIRKRLK
jgi:methionyl-tRNA formyltransferase